MALTIAQIEKKIGDLAKEMIDALGASPLATSLSKIAANADPTDNWTKEELLDLLMDNVWTLADAAWEVKEQKAEAKAWKAEAKAKGGKAAKPEAPAPAPKPVAPAKAEAKPEAPAKAAKPISPNLAKFLNDKIAKMGIAAVMKAYKNDVAQKTAVGTFLLSKAPAKA